MKEVMAFIRTNKVNATKNALAENGFPAFTCRPVLGRGKAGIDPAMLEFVMTSGALPQDATGEHMTEVGRLIAKRFFTIVVNDDEVKKVVDVLISVNKTGNKGDGKIFILPIIEAYKVRSGEQTLIEH